VNARTIWMYALIGLLVFSGAMFLGIALNS
jgi:hypothetical protein